MRGSHSLLRQPVSSCGQKIPLPTCPRTPSGHRIHQVAIVVTCPAPNVTDNPGLVFLGMFPTVVHCLQHGQKAGRDDGCGVGVCSIQLDTLASFWVLRGVPGSLQQGGDECSLGSRAFDPHAGKGLVSPTTSLQCMHSCMPDHDTQNEAPTCMHIIHLRAARTSVVMLTIESTSEKPLNLQDGMIGFSNAFIC